MLFASPISPPMLLEEPSVRNHQPAMSVWREEDSPCLFPYSFPLFFFFAPLSPKVLVIRPLFIICQHSHEEDVDFFLWSFLLFKPFASSLTSPFTCAYTKHLSNLHGISGWNSAPPWPKKHLLLPA